MITAEHGHAYANAIPGAQFKLIAQAGHLPQLEAPAELLATLWQFASSHFAGAAAEPGSATA